MKFVDETFRPHDSDATIRVLVEQAKCDPMTGIASLPDGLAFHLLNCIQELWIAFNIF
jgi:hypothetical protein